MNILLAIIPILSSGRVHFSISENLQTTINLYSFLRVLGHAIP